MSLLQAIISDSKKASARALERDMERQRKKEKKYGMGKSLFKSALNLLPGIEGKILSAGVDLIADPMLRKHGYGAQASEINLTGSDLAFGGGKASSEARTGVRDYLSDDREQSQINALMGLISAGGDFLDGGGELLSGGGDLGLGSDTLYDTTKLIPSNASYKQGGMVKKYQEGGMLSSEDADLYMDNLSEYGLQDFLRTPKLANLIKEARGGSGGAMMTIVNIIRKSRPELEASDSAIIESIKKALPKMDLYGEGYQDISAQGDTALTGLTQKAQEQRAGIASQAAQTGIRTGSGGFKGGDSITEGLYAGAENVYGQMQKGIQSEFDKSFGGFEDLITSV